MMDDTIKKEWDQILPDCPLILNEPMSRHTSFRTGGCADAFADVRGVEQLKRILSFLKQKDLPFYIIGNGSNLLVSDRGYRGVILKIGEGMADIKTDGNILEAQAGTLLCAAANRARMDGLSGLEFAFGIPGSVGGAMVMNAGAYDGEMSRIVRNVYLCDRTGRVFSRTKEEMEFGYRTSVIKKTSDIVLSVQMELEPKDETEISAKMDEFGKKRREKQPLEYPSAGSFFKRPEGYFAGKLIMEAGMRGYQIGGAQVSEKHCGFLINKEHASAQDIFMLMQKVQEEVKRNSGVELEPEVLFLGDFS